MNVELTINGSVVDLSPDTKIGTTFQVNNIAELKDRRGAHTNQFKLPKTSHNASVLGFADLVNSISNKPYRRLPAQLKQNGVEVVPSGFAIVEDSSSHFNLTIYSGNADFFQLIEGKKLSDINLELFSHEWEFSNVVGSFPNTYGYTYPQIDYFNLFSDVEFMNDPTRMYPSMFCSTLLTKICDDVGYKLAGSFLGTEKYSRLILPFCNQYPKHSDLYQEQFYLKVTKTTNQQIVGSLPADNVTFETVNFDNGGHWTGTDFFPTRSGKYNFKITANVTVTVLGGAPVISLQMSTSSISLVSAYGYVLTNPGTYTVEFITGDIYLTMAQAIRLQMSITSGLGDLWVLAGSTFEVIKPDSDEAFYNSKWEMALNQPDMSQKDFIKGICNMCCLITDADPLSKTLNLNNFSDIALNKHLSRDWSSKIDVSSPPAIAFRTDTYGQENFMRYEEDKEADPNKVGDGSFTIDDTTLAPKVEALKLPFGATVMKKKWIVFEIPEILIYDTATSTRIDVKPRILMHCLSNVSVGSGILFDDGGGGGAYVTTGIPFAWFIHDPIYTRPTIPINENLGFGNNLLEYHYADLLAMLDRLKKVTAYFNLHDEDVQDFDHMIPVYIEKFQEHFFVNKISNYQPGKLTQCELYRL